MSAHTPGPWIAVQHPRGSKAWRVTLTPDNARGDICNVLGGLGAVDEPQIKANARLIAAAPEMLAELQNIITANIHQEDRRRIEEVIAKATQP